VAAKNMVGKAEKYRIRETLTVKLMGKSLEARWWK
jgi:hypothetical protein